MGKTLSGDFIGFTFNGVHSSTLGIMRVSNGSRYTEDLLPPHQDKVVEPSGADGAYYFGSRYKQKTVSISFVFDDLREFQIKKLKQLFGDKEVHELWFDETPYRAYNAKVTGTPNLKYICFDIKDEFSQPVRVYKGEGSINFVIYYPFAFSRFKYLNQYGSQYGNKNEWASSSKMKIKGSLDSPIPLPSGQRQINLWNAGDLETDFKLNIYFENSKKITDGLIQLNNGNALLLKEILKQGDDDGIQINTRLKLIQGFKIINNKIELTENLYNKYIKSGDFFKIPLNSSILMITGLYGSANGKLDIDYKYWYF